MKELYYLQDKRTYVGNDILWWAKNHKGYTTDISKAHVFTKEEAIYHNQHRETDVPWLKSYIDKKVRPAVDMQHVNIDDGLAGTGIVLNKPKPQPKQKYRCTCGRFIRAEEYYTMDYCKHGVL